MAASVLLLVLIVLVAFLTAYSVRSPRILWKPSHRTNSRLYSSSDNGSIEAKMKEDASLQNYLKGPEGKAWKGSRDLLKRKNQEPNSTYLPPDVVRICLKALQNNDEPQLDHGCCVVLEFKSPSGILAEGNLDPAAYGRFLRSSDDYSSLIDYKSAELVGAPVAQQDELSVKQRVKIESWSGLSPKRSQQFYDFYLTRVGELWLLDVILFVSE